MLTTSSRARAIVVTALVLVTHYFLPPKYMELHSYHLNQYTLYSDGEAGGSSNAKWLDKQQTSWFCDLVQSRVYPFCGFTIHWNDTHKEGLNLSGYAVLKLRLRYQGPAHSLRIFMRGFEPDISQLDNLKTHKFMYANVPISSIGSSNQSHQIVIPFDDFQVADWWKEEYSIEHSKVDSTFDHISSLGIDFPYAQVIGEHTIELESAELTGEWLSAEGLYLGIIVVWLSVLFLGGLVNMYRWRELAKENLKQVQDLKDYAQELRERSEKYRELSHIDNLTEIFNRYGFMQTLKNLFGKRSLKGCLLVIDIDFFKSINDSYGHTIGDQVLVEVAQLISKSIRKSDIFARWGGEEFVLLVTDYELSPAQVLAEKLRCLIEDNKFTVNEDIKITISIGLTPFSQRDSLDSAFIRADEALYMAKSHGRNQVVTSSRTLEL